MGPDDAADVLQDVFQAVYVAIGGFRRDRPGDSFRGWLWTITRSKIQDVHRARAKQPGAPGGTAAQQRLLEVPEVEPPCEAAGDRSASTWLFEGLEPIRAEFEDRTWQAFWRAVVHGEPTAQIAADLGMTVNAVRKAKCRVLHRLREELEGLGLDGEE
jgi:RNA polymerase sigma-70 factor (ECF subfamily)